MRSGDELLRQADALPHFTEDASRTIVGEDLRRVTPVVATTVYDLLRA